MTAKLVFPKYVPESVRMEAQRLLQAFPAAPYSAAIKSLITREEMRTRSAHFILPQHRTICHCIHPSHLSR